MEEQADGLAPEGSSSKSIQTESAVRLPEKQTPGSTLIASLPVLLGSLLTLAGTISGLIVHCADTWVTYHTAIQEQRTKHVQSFKETITGLSPTLLARHSSPSEIEVSLVNLYALVDEIPTDDTELTTKEYTEIASIAAAINVPEVQEWLANFYSGQRNISKTLPFVAVQSIADAQSNTAASHHAKDDTPNFPSFVTEALTNATVASRDGWIYLGRGIGSGSGKIVCQLNYFHTIGEGASTARPQCLASSHIRDIVDTPRSGDKVKILIPVNFRYALPASHLGKIIGILKPPQIVQILDEPQPIRINEVNYAVWAHVQIVSQ